MEVFPAEGPIAAEQVRTHSGSYRVGWRSRAAKIIDNRMKSAISLAVSFLLLASICATGGSNAARPNILVILADDLGYGDTGFQGCKDIPTPNLDALAREGVRFTSGYVTGPYCSPSRAGLMVGKCQQRFSFEGNPQPITVKDRKELGLDVEEKTIADRLKVLGYATGIVGKWHLGEEERFHPLNRGFDEFFGFLGGAHSYFKETDEVYGPLLRNREPGKADGYLTDVFAHEAIAFIERHKDRPFLLYLAFNAVHAPAEALEADMARVSGIKNLFRRTYAAMTMKMDQAIGNVLAALRKARLDERTLIFFLSDNGGPVKDGPGHIGASNAPLRGEKMQLLEGGIRVPFLIRWSGVLLAGKVDDRPIIQLDILPTALAAAGVEVDPAWKLDGVNLLPYLTGHNDALPHRALYWRSTPQAAIRSGPWKLVKWRMPGKEAKKTSLTAPELYNLDDDISETKNLAAAYPEKVRELAALWDEWNKSTRVPIRNFLSRDKQ